MRILLSGNGHWCKYALRGVKIFSFHYERLFMVVVAKRGGFAENSDRKEPALEVQLSTFNIIELPSTFAIDNKCQIFRISGDQKSGVKMHTCFPFLKKFLALTIIFTSHLHFTIFASKQKL